MDADARQTIVITGMACRVPGAGDLAAFSELLFGGQTGYRQLPDDRCDRELYFDSRKGQTGKSYTAIGGTVPERSIDRSICPLSDSDIALSDVTHLQFAEVAATAWRNAGLIPGDRRLSSTGVYVGHSGGTKSGGGLSLASQIEEALCLLADVPEFRQLSQSLQQRVVLQTVNAIRSRRPSRKANASPNFHAYQAAALAAKALELTGPRQVIDAACASSLVALSQAMFAIRAGRIDSAIVGGATYNNIDNLILFSHSQACTAEGSCPFDDRASGLVSSEGYVAAVVTTLQNALKNDLPILCTVRGVGMASDGRGRSLWAPRKEGQVLALGRAYGSHTPTLDVDYLEAHATSTQLGDATELETLRELIDGSSEQVPLKTPEHRISSGSSSASSSPLLIGSVKSNIGHTLEAAGLIGLVKILLSMEQEQLPPSLRFEKPNRNCDWHTAPFRVVQRVQPWKIRSPFRTSRRAAVSAFGIGGLNAHVVVEESASGRDHFETSAHSSNRNDANVEANAEPIAIVGRGVVLAGANSVGEFRELLSSQRSAISEAPTERWAGRIGVSAGNAPQSFATPHCRGGFITDFQFDGARYRIPPKQVQQANPVQMMLLDSVTQALSEVRQNTDERMSTDSQQRRATSIAEQDASWPFDRKRIGVVVGTVFGGEFGGQLQVGMRLPEISKQLLAELTAVGLNVSAANQICEDFRRVVLQQRPALLDETGSFTASTLASRIAKTFDLMGGAAALDADDASSLTALAVATDQLRAGIVDMVVCGTACRAMNLAAFENLDLNGQLVRSGLEDDVPDNCKQILPGEGVASVMLCRLSDARRLGLKVYGVLNKVAHVPYSEERSASCLNRHDAEIVRKVGYLPGSHSLVRIVAETLRDAGKPEPLSLFARTKDCITLEARFQCDVPEFLPHSSQAIKTMPTETKPTTGQPRTFRFSAPTGAQLLATLQNAALRPSSFFEKKDLVQITFAAVNTYRAAIVASSVEELGRRLKAAIKAVEADNYRVLLDRDRVVLWRADSTTSRVAWLFPGQGSHYPETPSVFASSEAARNTLAQVDTEYVAKGLPALSGVFGNKAIKPGEDVWWAQAWVLGVAASLTAALKAEGLRPDVVLGHSFGEFTASLASQVTTLAETVDLARHRSNAVISHMRTPGRLVSVRAAVHEVDALVKSAGLPVYVTHLNSPRQTVIAGSCDGISQAKELLDRNGFASIMIPVPAPFHTPLLADAEVVFERMSSGVALRPPVCGFLSATSVQYLAEPSGIRSSLVRQLTQPVMFMPSVQRLLSEGYRVFLEVGPNDVLTRLTRDIAESHAICLSLDVPGQPFEERLALVRAVLECVGVSAQDAVGPSNRNVLSLAMTTSSSTGSRAAANVTANPISQAGPQSQMAANSSVNAASVVFDVTRLRRTQNKPLESTGEVHTGFVQPDTGFETIAEAVPPIHLQPETEAVPLQLKASSLSASQLRIFLRDLVVELTGYSPDIVDFDADLEADLGIDSIKKAQILGELGEWMGLSVRPDSLRLDSVRTLDDAISTAVGLAESQGVAVSSASAVSNDAIEPSVNTSASPNDTLTTSASSASPALPTAGHLDALLVDYVIDQTGYTRDIVDIDADLESELGLDSIKMAQLIGEMREQFVLESLTLETVAQSRFQTLRQIREFLLKHMAAMPPSGSPSGLQSDVTYSSPSLAPMSSASAQSGMQGVSADELSESVWDATESPLQSRPLRKELRSANAATFMQTETGLRSTLKSSRIVPVEEVLASVVSKSEPKLRGFDSLTVTDHRLKHVFALDCLKHDSPNVAFLEGIKLGKTLKSEIRSSLQSIVSQKNPVKMEVVSWSPIQTGWLRGIAQGAGVAEASVHVAASLVAASRKGDAGKPVVSGRVGKTHRFVLKVVSSPRRSGMPSVPELHGPALILGNNPLAHSLAEYVRNLGQQAYVLDVTRPVTQIEPALQQLWQEALTPHVFLTMAWDQGAVVELSKQSWQSRRSAALEVPFRICQTWMQQMIDADQMEDASVIAVTRLGGDFGFSGQHVQSFEAIGGLVKAMLIEAWMRGFRTTPMKVIDAPAEISAAELARGVLHELAVPSYDMEIAFRRCRDVSATASPDRLSVQAEASPLPSVRDRHERVSAERIAPGGIWIVSGGGRGITAAVAMGLAEKYDLQLHLLGTAPVPSLSSELLEQVAQDRSAVRRQIMQDASIRSESPVEAWRNVEKAIEIEATLRKCQQKGITAFYHCCDVSDFGAVERTIDDIRSKYGAISGVLHGAGAGQDARFDRKRPDKVDKCLKAKIDGCLAMMLATASDPLQWFVGFGSISGRFGANGHTDYSLANDMMAKIVDRYRIERPDVRSVTFHWHAWGDIGMATKPEAKLALEMIDMEFMPAEEGIDHFMRELEFGGNEAEVLITDESYFRKFFPAERLTVADGAGQEAHVPLIPVGVTKQNEAIWSSVVTLNPLTDKFLSQHLVQGRPTLPFVVALELMAEAVRLRTGYHPEVCLKARAMQAIRFMTDDPLAVTVQTHEVSDGTFECRLLADVRRRDGRMVEEDRVYFAASFEITLRHQQANVAPGETDAHSPVQQGMRFQKIKYATPDGLIYHGPELQELRRVADDGVTIVGRIAASAAVQLFGAERSRGFTVPCTTMDACLYAVGYAAWQRHQRARLPVQFDRIEFGRQPDPGEPCVVSIRETSVAENSATWNFELSGNNGDRLLAVVGYRTGWLKG